MRKYELKDIDEIRNHQSLKKSDGNLHRRDTIKYWIERIDKNGDIETIKKTGRPRLLDDEKTKVVIDTIKKKTNRKKRYPKIQRMLIQKNIEIKRRTLNNYAIRNNIRKFI
jgi:transposase